MKRTRLYRQIAALILLVMYAFIATPVHLWHHHSSATASIAKRPAKAQKTTSIDLPGKTSSDNCPVCAHKYSVYSDIEVSYTLPVVDWTYVQFAYPDSSTPDRAILYTDSRGPPTT